MIDHTSVPVTDFETSKEFYTAILAPLGYSLISDLSQYQVAGFGIKEHTDFWIGHSEKAGGVHVAFKASSKEMVEAFHQAGLAAGGADNGAPGYREMYAPNYYGAFVHDADGNNIEAVFHDPALPSA